MRQLASLLGAIVLVAACSRNESEVAQTRAEGSTGGADGTLTEAAGSPEAGFPGRVVFDADWDISTSFPPSPSMRLCRKSTALFSVSGRSRIRRPRALAPFS